MANEMGFKALNVRPICKKGKVFNYFGIETQSLCKMQEII